MDAGLSQLTEEMDASFIIESASLKHRVKEHWEQEACGERYGDKTDRKLFFEEVSTTRYARPPARFEQ